MKSLCALIVLSLFAATLRADPDEYTFETDPDSLVTSYNWQPGNYNAANQYSMSGGAFTSTIPNDYVFTLSAPAGSVAHVDVPDGWATAYIVLKFTWLQTGSSDGPPRQQSNLSAFTISSTGTSDNFPTSVQFGQAYYRPTTGESGLQVIVQIPLTPGESYSFESISVLVDGSSVNSNGSTWVYNTPFDSATLTYYLSSSNVANPPLQPDPGTFSSFAAVPEPATTAALMGLFTLAGVMVWRRRRA